jgi:hypothetical protein
MMASDPRGGRHGTETRQTRIHLRNSSFRGGIHNAQHMDGCCETRGRLEGTLSDRDDSQVWLVERVLKLVHDTLN